MNEVVKIIPDQNDIRKYFYSVMMGNSNFSDELHDRVSLIIGKQGTGIKRKDLEKFSIVRLLLLLDNLVSENSEFCLFGIRDKKTGKEWSFLFKICLANRDEMAIMDLTGWDNSSLYLLDVPMDSDDFCVIPKAHDLWLGNNKAFIFRGSGDDGMFFSLVSYLRENIMDREVTMAGIEINHIEKEGPYAGGSHDKFWYRLGFVDKAYYPLSPMIFTGGSNFSEGLAAVCFSGRWGYVNEDFLFKLSPEFGYAEPFSGGISRVLVLNEEGKKRKGVWKEYRTEGLEIYNLPEALRMETAIPSIIYTTTEFPETIFLPETNFNAWKYNGVESYHDFSISMWNYDVFKDYHLNHFLGLGKWAIIDTKGLLIWEQTADNQYPSRTEQGYFAIYSPGEIAFLDSKGKRLAEKQYNADQDPAIITDIEEDSYNSYRKAAFKLSSDWKESAQINGKNLSFSFALHLFHLINTPGQNHDGTEKIPVVIRKNKLTNSAEFRLYTEIRQFTDKNEKYALETGFQSRPEKILEFLANGMEAIFITRIAKDLLQNVPFLRKAVKMNALVLEHLEPDVLNKLLTKKAQLLHYIKEVKKHAVKNRMGPSNSRKGKIPLIDSGKVRLDDYIKSCEDAFKFIQVFNPVYEYLPDEFANDPGCIDLILQLQKDFVEWDGSFLYAQALTRKTLYVDKKRISKEVRKQLSIFPELLELLPLRFQKDKKLILEVLKKSNYENSDLSPFRFAWPALLKNSDFVLAAVGADQEAFAILPETYKSDLSFISRMFELDIFDIFRSTQHVSKNLLDSEEFWECMSEDNYFRYIMARYASKRIKEIYNILPEEALGAEVED